MPKLVISTVGTSLLTNCIDRDIDPDNWLKRLQDTANYTDEEISKHYQDVSQIITELKERAEEKLYDDETEISEIRETCAELNGIYGLYGEDLEQGISDTHILIATDTAQGIITSKIIEKFLQDKGLPITSTYIQPQLSLASSSVFSEAVAGLIPYIRNTIEGCTKNQYQICFNLVGGFKALQGYFNTIGMFYADEIIYVFEGSNEVITIPRLPIKVDIDKIEPFKVQLAMMEQGDVSKSWEKLNNIPHNWVLVDGQEMTLSTWGQLIWNDCQYELLSQDLLEGFPRIKYDESFRRDYKKITDNNDKVLLHKTIAKVSRLLEESNGDTRGVAKQVEYYPYRGAKDKKGVDHFYVGIQFRVSCQKQGEILMLRHYGTHKYVEGKETT
jgi:putative CRISPR-associated protein (TIGR02619 family)